MDPLLILIGLAVAVVVIVGVRRLRQSKRGSSPSGGAPNRPPKRMK